MKIKKNTEIFLEAGIFCYQLQEEEKGVWMNEWEIEEKEKKGG